MAAVLSYMLFALTQNPNDSMNPIDDAGPWKLEVETASMQIQSVQSARTSAHRKSAEDTTQGRRRPL